MAEICKNRMGGSCIAKQALYGELTAEKETTNYIDLKRDIKTFVRHPQ